MVGWALAHAVNFKMSNYRRANFPGGYYFFTVVTYNRKKLFNNDCARNCLHKSWLQTQDKRPFELIALCLLPDHLHCIWKLPEDDSDYSTRWASIKALFTREFNKNRFCDYPKSRSRIKHRESTIWQRRFWEHQLRDVLDLENHINYIHFNPVKHKLVEKVDDWPWSTYGRYENNKTYNFKTLKYKVPDGIDFGE